MGGVYMCVCVCVFLCFCVDVGVLCLLDHVSALEATPKVSNVCVLSICVYQTYTFAQSN